VWCVKRHRRCWRLSTRPAKVFHDAAGNQLGRFRDDLHRLALGASGVDLVTLLNRDAPLVTPFVVVGAGLFQTRESFLDNETFTSSEGAFTAGGGVRGPIGERMMLGVEARVGWELHVRVNAVVGVCLGR
jgi:hypothetical protein